MIRPNKECPCSSQDLQLWDKKALQVEVEEGNWEKKAPVTTNENATRHEFYITADGERYTDLKNSYLEVEVQVCKEDGSNMTGTDEVALVNNAMHGLFSQVVVSLNKTIVTSSNSTYHVKACLETLLSFGLSALKNEDSDRIVNTFVNKHFSGVGKYALTDGRFVIHQVAKELKMLYKETDCVIKMKTKIPVFFFHCI